MVTVLLRTVIIYTMLIGALRFMGKRQIGELEISELVTTLLISEIASLPIENSEYPILYAIVPIVTLLFVEILSSFLLIRFPLLKHLFSSRPTVLIKNGTPIEKELLRVRISPEELISSLRQKGVTEIGDVEYAILEPNGQLSVIERSGVRPLCADDLGLSLKERGITHILISNGRIDRYNEKMLKNGRALIKKALSDEGCRKKEVLLLLVNDLGEITLIKKTAPNERSDGETKK